MPCRCPIQARGRFTWNPRTDLGKTLLGAGLAILFGFAIADGNPALAQGSWETKASMPNIKTGGFHGVIDGKFHAGGGGGVSPPSNPINDEHYKYDPGTDTWTFRAPIPTTRGGKSALIDGKFYVVGGALGFDARIGVINFLEAYDPDTNSWSTLAPMPTARVQHAAAALDGKLFVVGGVAACLPCLPQIQTIEVYDPVSDTWDTTPRALMPTGRENASAAAINGKLYVVGGLVRDLGNAFIFSVTDVLEVYDPVGDSWSTKAPMPTSRANAMVEVIGGKLHVVGGANNVTVVATHEVYDPLTDTWSMLAPMPTARSNAMTGVIDNRLYVAGGGGSGGNVDILEVFTLVIDVAIDIKPGSFPNSINQGSGGVIPVAILGSDTFDATQVDGSTCTLGDAYVKVVGKSDKLLCSVEDVSGDFSGGPEGAPDGFLDQVCKFVTIDLGAALGDTEATIHCSAPEEIEGTDTIRIVPPG